MCLAIPAKITAIDGDYASVNMGGVEITVCISLVENLKIGDYVIVHAGFAIHVLDLGEAVQTLELFREFNDEHTE